MPNFPSTIHNEFAYATDCNLATLSSLRMRKSSAKSDISRQTNICLRMLAVCQEHKASITFGDGFRHHFSRVEKILEYATTHPMGLALDKWNESHG